MDNCWKEQWFQQFFMPEERFCRASSLKKNLISMAPYAVSLHPFSGGVVENIIPSAFARPLKHRSVRQAGAGEHFSNHLVGLD
jgi:hypothetical protein